MKLSIIICIYNTPRYFFEGCCHSLFKSTLIPLIQDGEVEVILIDDGSDTYYTDIIEKYGIRCVRTENRGIFHARCLGVRMARGKYVGFIDSDDTVSFNYHAPMVEMLEKTGAEIVINDWAYHTESSRYYATLDSTLTSDLSLKGNEPIKAFLAQEGREHSYYVLWNKLYRRELLTAAAERTQRDTKKIDRFNYSEDALINFYAFLGAKHVQNLHTGYYFYRIHPSQSVRVVSEERLKRQITLMSFTLDKMDDEIKRAPEHPALCEHINAWRALMSRSHFTHAKSAGYKSLYRYIKKAYGIERLRRSTYRDEICGMRCHPLPDNFEKIDEALFSSWQTRTIPKLPKRKIEYITNTVIHLSEAIGSKSKYEIRTNSKPIIPEPIIPFRKRLVFNPILMRIARLIFPKGSKIRSFLKRRI